MEDDMTTTDPIDMPTITEAKANEILDDVVQSVVVLRDEQGADIEMSTSDKLLKLFGDSGQVVAQLIMFGALRGFDLGLIEATPGSDRTDILASTLRRVHAKEMFGDCEEDGEHYPCKTVRMLDLVTGAPADPDLDNSLEEGAAV